MTRYLTVEQALQIACTAVGGPIEVRDIGLLESAAVNQRAVARKASAAAQRPL